MSGLDRLRAQDACRLVGVRPHDADHHRDGALLGVPGLDEPPGDLVAPGDAPEDVHEDGLDLRIGEDQGHRSGHLVGPCAAADVEEVRGLAAGPLHEIHGGHRQPGAVDHAADVAVELDEADSLLARDPDEEAPEDREAREAGLTFIKLDGTIGCMVNGAGLAMTTMDLVKRAGGEPANFLDIGGGARAEKVAHAMRLILSDPKVDAILVNIFGGITRGDEVARGLIEARAQQSRDVPMVVRIVGTNAAEAAVLLEEARFETAATLDEAAAKAVAASRAGTGTSP